MLGHIALKPPHIFNDSGKEEASPFIIIVDSIRPVKEYGQHVKVGRKPKSTVFYTVIRRWR